MRVVKNPSASAEDERGMDSIPGMGRYPGVGIGNLIQHSCLENSKDGRSLKDYSPWDCEKLDTTECLIIISKCVL